VLISDTHTFSPTLVNEFKIGYSRDYGYWYDTNYGEDILSQLGLQGISNPAGDPAIAGMPIFDIGGSNGFAGTGNWANGNSQAQNTYQVTDNISWFTGRHHFKFGADVRRYQINDQVKPTEMRGAYYFDDRLSGFAFANFLLGYPSSATRAIARPNAYPRSTHSGFYMQDEFKVNARISLTYGLRYEYQTPWVEKYDRMYSFDTTSGSLVTAGESIPTDLVPEVAATLPIISASQAGLPTRSLMYADKNNWSPRAGLAWRPFGNDQTVVRFGYGLYTAIWPGLLALNATGGPWQSSESFFITDDQPTIQFPDPFAVTSEFAGLQSVNAVNPYFPNERTQQWNVSVGRQIWGTAIDVAYVGTKGKNIPFWQDLNLPLPSTQPFDPASRPYQRFDTVGLTQAGASSIYHGLTIQADRRMARGVMFNVNYTLAKALTDADLRGYAEGAQQNQWNRALERGNDPNIRRHVLQFSYVLDVPFGRGRKLFSGASGVANQLISGWQLSGITRMLSGQFLSPSFSGTDPANTNQWGGRPDRVGAGTVSGDIGDLIRSRQPIFDESAFVVPETGRGFYGNSGRMILTAPSSVTWNIVGSKNFSLAERARLQFRVELFNAFNTPNFNAPNMDVTSGGFGLVTSAASGRRLLIGARIDY
jgi:hypothetical protein